MKTLAATFLCALAAAPMHAQITNPDALVSSPPASPQARQRDAQPQDLQWLWQYAGSEKSTLLADPRFTALLREHLKAPQSFWGTYAGPNGSPAKPLSEAAAAFLAGEGRVSAINNRYLTVTGCIEEQCAQQGLLWIDLGAPQPLLVFIAMRWAEQGRTPSQPGAPFSLWFFPDRAVDPLPQPLKTTLSAWLEASDCASRPIIAATIVDPDGAPHTASAAQLGISPACMNATPGTHS